MQTITERKHYLDWLRILAIFGVLLYHSAMPFMPEETWHINNESTSNLLMEFNFWLSSFSMHLLFFISGAVSIYVIRNQSIFSFIGIRVRRLFIPVIVGIFIIVPPQIYFERLSQGFNGNFLDFYSTVLQFIPYPAGNTSWHHLWFIAYLILYNILLAPFFKWSVSANGKLFAEKLQFFARSQRIYLLMIPAVLWFSFTVIYFPQTHDVIHDYCYFIYWLLFLLIGYLFMLHPALMDSLERNRKISLAMAFLLMVAINSFRWNGFEWTEYISDWQRNPWTPIFISRISINSWFWVFAIVGYAKRYFNKTHKSLSYLNEAVYPFYILHQTVIVIIGYYVLQTTDTIGMKFLFITVLGLILSLGIYHLYIRPFNLMRILFGLKAIGQRKKKTVIHELDRSLVKL